MKQLYFLLLVCALSTASWAQLADGTTAPNFTLTDIDGNTHTLYDYIDQGKTVVLDFGATWCGPCWSYHNGGALEYFWDNKGPDGTDESMVFWIESDLSTGWNDLIGATGASQGNWVATTSFPIIDVTTSAVPDAYNVNYYPTLYKVCADYKVYEVGQVPGTTWENWIQSCTMEASLVGVNGTDCYGFGEGGAECTGSGGYGSISFNWSNGQNGPILSGVEAGSYTCIVEDDNGREILISGITVTGPGTPITMANSSIDNLLCYGDMSGSITVAGQGGNGGFTYNWSNGASGATATNLAGGAYQVTIVDQNGCESDEFGFQVFEPTDVEYTYTAVNAHCDQNDGLIFVDPSGGTGPYDLTADGGSVNNVLFQVADLIGGTYNVDVIDANGCVESQSITIDNEPGPEVFMPSSVELSCANPTALLVPEIEYVNFFDLVFQWTTPDGNILEGEFDPECLVNQPGTYTLFIEDVLYGCNVVDEVIITGSVDAPTVNAGEDLAIDCDNLAIGINATLGNLPPEYDIVWSSENGNVVSGQGTPEVVVDEPGSYLVEVTNTENGCVGQDIVVVVDNRSFPEAGYNFDATYLDVVFTNTSTGDGVTYSWNFGDGGTSTEANPSHSFPFTGTYTVCLEVTNGCGTASHCFDVYVEQEASAIQITATVNHVTCHGDANGSIQVEVAGGTGTYTYQWVGPNGFTNEVEDLTGLTAGTYLLTVTDDAGNETQIQIVIVEPEELVVGIELTQSFSGPVLAANAAGGTPGYIYEWSNGSTSAVLQNVPSGTYSVVITDANGCFVASESIRVINPNDIDAYPNDYYVELSGNPASQPITVQIGGNVTPETGFTYRIVNIAGQILDAGTWTGEQGTVDLRDQMPGIYFLAIYSNDKDWMSTERLIIAE